MNREKNIQIGEVECPQKGCTAKVPVFRFRQRTEGRSRYAGKLYSDCPVHGRYGADGKDAAQEYILENAKIWGSEKSAVITVPSPDPAPPKAADPTNSAAPVSAGPLHVKSSPPAQPVPDPPPAKSSPWWKPILG